MIGPGNFLSILDDRLALRKNGETLVTALSESGGLNPVSQAVRLTLKVHFSVPVLFKQSWLKRNCCKALYRGLVVHFFTMLFKGLELIHL